MLFNDTIAANIAYGTMAGASRDGDRARRGGGQRARLHPRRSRRASTRRRRARHPAVGRPAAADRDRARDPQGCADPDPRRSDLGARHRIRAADPGGARSPDARPHDDRDRAPAVDDRALRPHRRARRRARSSSRARTPSCSRTAASTRGCIRASSATRTKQSPPRTSVRARCRRASGRRSEAGGRSRDRRRLPAGRRRRRPE